MASALSAQRHVRYATDPRTFQYIDKCQKIQQRIDELREEMKRVMDNAKAENNINPNIIKKTLQYLNKPKKADEDHELMEETHAIISRLQERRDADRAQTADAVAADDHIDDDDDDDIDDDGNQDDDDTSNAPVQQQRNDRLDDAPARGRGGPARGRGGSRGGRGRGRGGGRPVPY